MAADAAPREKMAFAIGTVQTAQRIGPALGPVIGGMVAALVGLRQAFLVTSIFYVVALALVFVMYKEPAHHTQADDQRPRRVSFRSVLAFENFVLLIVVVFALTFVDRSLGPVLPLYIAELGLPIDDIPLVSGVVFSIAAGAGAVGNHLSRIFLGLTSTRGVIAGAAAFGATGMLLYVFAGGTALLMVGALILGLALGGASTAAYTAAGAIIPAHSRGAGFGLLSTGSLVGLASSPIICGLLGTLSLRAVFVLDTVILVLLALVVRRLMVQSHLTPTSAPATEEV